MAITIVSGLLWITRKPGIICAWIGLDLAQKFAVTHAIAFAARWL
jgi:hypothetical protein